MQEEQEQEQEQEQDFGIPDERESGSEPKGWPSESDLRYLSLNSIPTPDDHEVKAKLITRPKNPKPRGRPKSDLSSLLNAIAGEIEETMDLLVLARGSLAVSHIKDPDQRIEVLCRRVSASLLLVQDIIDRIAAVVED